MGFLRFIDSSSTHTNPSGKPGNYHIAHSLDFRITIEHKINIIEQYSSFSVKPSYKAIFFSSNLSYNDLK